MIARRHQRFAAVASCSVALAIVAVIAADRLFPPDVLRLTPSQTVVDRHGTILRAFQTSDAQWRLKTQADSVSGNYLHMLVAVEDKRFWHHPGIDPLALARAFGQLVTHGRIVSGGSTLTMQVVRLLEPRPRTLRSKLIEAFRALQLEARLSKAQILDAYLTLTPMGGNLEGVRAGSLAWFGKEPKTLSDAEAALLIALPQAPRRTRPDAHPGQAAHARARVLALATQADVIDAASAQAARQAPLPDRRRPLPKLAPHLAGRLAAEHPAERAISTALDAWTQAGIERILRQSLDELPRPINVAAVVADWHTGEILGRAGSGAYGDATRSGAIDMTLAVRSPGSTLKPFIYGMAFDGLLAHPGSLVRDEPTRFDDYAPHNFDGSFNGDITVRRALQASLNLPAVTVLDKVGPVAFAARFRQAGLPLTFNDEWATPSLPIALGGVGLTLEKLVTAYAALADGGAMKPLIDAFGGARDAVPGESLMRRASADAVVDILADMPPPKGVVTHAGRVAYKTGTSYRFRDGWAVGFDGSRVIGVWMGRADGGTCIACVGVASAGVLFRLFDVLPPDPLPKRELSPVFAGPPPRALARLTQVASLPRASDPHIAFPLPGAHLLADAGSPDIKLTVDGGERPYRWSIDGRPIDSRPFAHEARWRPSGEGFSTVTVTDAAGHSDVVRVRIVGRQ